MVRAQHKVGHGLGRIGHMEPPHPYQQRQGAGDDGGVVGVDAQHVFAQHIDEGTQDGSHAHTDLHTMPAQAARLGMVVRPHTLRHQCGRAIGQGQRYHEHHRHQVNRQLVAAHGLTTALA